MNISTKIRLSLLTILAILAMIWIFQNGGIVETKFLFVTLEMPKSALLAITLLVGIVAGILVTWSVAGKCNNTKTESSNIQNK